MPTSATRKFDAPKARLARLHASLRAHDLGHMLVTNPKDVAYLTGFLGGDSYLFVGENKPVLLSDSRYEEDLRPFADLCDIRMRKGMMLDEVAALLGEKKPEKCGVQSEALTLEDHEKLKKKLKSAGLKAGAVSPISGVVRALRRVKDEDEIKHIRKAIKIQEEAIEAIKASIQPGRKEMEIAADLEAEMKSRGSQNPSFSTIVANGANSSRPHHSVSAASVTINRPVLIDWGAISQGYHSDMTRTFAMGAFPPKIREIYPIVLEAHERAAAALKAGALAKDVDAAARDHIAAAGFGEKFGHGLGHGIGLDVHEAPSLSRLSGETLLEEGNVVTVEPGIYLPGVGGVRIEDDYVVTKTGAKRLSTLPKDIHWATL